MSAHTCGSGWQGNCAACARAEYNALGGGAEQERALEAAVVEAALRWSVASTAIVARPVKRELIDACAALRKFRKSGGR